VVVEIGRRKARKKARKAGCKSTSIRVPVSSFVTHVLRFKEGGVRRYVVHVGCELNETVITSFYIFTTFVRVTFLLGTYFYISTLLCYCGHVPHLNLNAHFLWL
jgi:hypothetical protein